jgi:hypothetical protein
MGTSQLYSVPYALHSETSGDSFWEITGSDLYYNNGNVGIGLNSPTADLHVAKNTADAEAIFGTDISSYDVGSVASIGSDDQDAVLYVGQTSNRKGFLIWQYNSTPANAYYSVGAFNGWNDLVLQEVGGNVGVGITSPTQLLHVGGNMRLNNAFYDSNNSPGTDGQILQSTGTATDWINASSISDGDWTISGTNMYSSVSGNVGIGTTSPSCKLDVVGSIEQDYPGAGNALHADGSTAYAMYYCQNTNAGNGWGLSAGMTSSSASSSSYGVYGFNYGTGYGVYGKKYNAGGYGVYGIHISTGNYGYAGSTNYGLYGYNNGGNYGYIGGSTYAVYGVHTDGNYARLGTAKYGVQAYLTTENVGDFAVRGYNSNTSGADGIDYDYNDVLGGVHGLSFYGNPYTFGVAGHSYLDYNRSGGNLGSDWGGNDWGCLAYQNSGGTEYGGYFTSYTSGTGKDAKAQINNGIGAWGDLFGADIHGKVYGAFIEGENYATYSKGTSFHDGLDVHLQKTGNNNTVLYTNVSTDATVQTSGYASLINGESNIAFDEVFAHAVSSETPIVVTVTPDGNSNGVYLSEVSNSGFKVIENNGGKSNVTITYIAIGKRAGYENPQLPQEVIDVEYTSKLTRGLHNDGDTETDGEGLYYENGKLTVGIHPSTLPDPNRPAPDVAETPVKPEVIETEDEFIDGRAEEIISEEHKTEDFQIITPQETQPENITPKAKEVTPKETKPVDRKPNLNTSDGGPEKK